MTIIFRQLPDMHTQDDIAHHGLSTYGRFGILPDGTLWLGDLRSSHPAELLFGWYWGITVDEELVLSSRNIGSKVELLQGNNNLIVKHLLCELVNQRVVSRRKRTEVL